MEGGARRVHHICNPEELVNSVKLLTQLWCVLVSANSHSCKSKVHAPVEDLEGKPTCIKVIGHAHMLLCSAIKSICQSVQYSVYSYMGLLGSCCIGQHSR